MESVREEWRPVLGFEGKHEVSNLGRVKTLAFNMRHWCGRDIPKPERIVEQSKHSGGYRIVALRDGKKHYVHRLVMAAFIGTSKPGQDVNHISGDKSDNSLANLEYCDRLHNVRHAIRTGLQDNAGEGNGMHKYTAAKIASAHAMVVRGATHQEASRATGVKESTIQQVAKGTRWKCLNLPAIA